MRVLHFILGKADKNRANGVNQIIAGLAKYSAQAGAEVRVIGKANSCEVEGGIIERDGFQVQAFTGWKTGMLDAVREAVEWSDIVHLHGTFQPANFRVGSICSEIGTPYVVAIHGGLSPDRRKGRGRFKKLIYDHVYEQRHLSQAAALHVGTEEEATEAWTLSTPQRVVIVPNGIDLEEYPQPDRVIRDSGAIKFGYIGRFGREKNIPNFCEGFREFNKERSHGLFLAGPEDADATAAKKMYPDPRIEFVGPRYGESKREFLDEIDVFVLPSLSEGFAISLVEALAAGLPTLVTRTSNAAYLQSSGAIELCEPTPFGLAAGLERISLNRDSWASMSANARQLVESQLNWSSAARQMVASYRELTGVAA